MTPRPAGTEEVSLEKADAVIDALPATNSLLPGSLFLPGYLGPEFSELDVERILAIQERQHGTAAPAQFLQRDTQARVLPGKFESGGQRIDGIFFLPGQTVDLRQIQV